MGSIMEINDTLQITREQGFPPELDLEKHKVTPLQAEDFAGKTFEFRDKPQIRMYQQAPIRNFLAENRGGKWLYWGLIHVLSVQHDHLTRTTSGTFKIIKIYTPLEMMQVYDLIDARGAEKFEI